MAACLSSRPVTGGQQCLEKGRSLTKDAYVLEMWTTVEPGMVSVERMHQLQQYCWYKDQVKIQTEIWNVKQQIDSFN